MFAYCQEAVGVPVDDFELIAVCIGYLVAGRQRRVEKRSPEKVGEQQGFEIGQVGLRFVTSEGAT